MQTESKEINLYLTILKPIKQKQHANLIYETNLGLH